MQSSDRAARGWATCHFARDGEPAHLIRYHPVKAPYLEHLICHECSHLLRLAKAPEADRYVPGGTHETYEHAVTDCLYDDPVRAMLMARHPHVMQKLYEGIVIQVTNHPVDIRIEQDLRASYPDLADTQAASLRDQVTELYPLTDPEIRLANPRKVFSATLHMGAVYAEFVGRLLDEPTLADPLRPFADQQTLSRLTGAIQHTRTPGHAGDREVVDRWTEILGLTGWYAWVPWSETQ